MQIAHDIAGFTLGEADIFRHAMSRKDEALLTAQREKLVEGAFKKGNLTESEAEAVFDWLKPMGRYAFNKAHTVAYSMLAYRMAYLKAHYPHEFMAAVMTEESYDSSKIARYREECGKLSDYLGIEINLLPPDINKSEKGYTVVGNAIRSGLVAVKGVGEEAIDKILTERVSADAFASLQDFRARVGEIDEHTIESLVESGAFNTIPSV